VGRNFVSSLAVALCVFVYSASAEAIYFRGCYKVTVAKPPPQQWNRNLDFKKMEQLLLTGKIINIETLRDYLDFLGRAIPQGSSESYAVFFEDGTVAVFKPESPTYVFGELLVYRISEYFGYHLVPPTVVRTINGKLGTLQLFIETERDPMESLETFKHLLGRVPEIEKEREKLIHYLAGQWDRHEGNLVVDDLDHLIAVDNRNAAATVRWLPGEFPWVLRGGNLPSPGALFPFNNYSLIVDPNPKVFKEKFGAYLSEKEIASFFKKGFGEHAATYAGGPVPYIVWEGGLWIQKRTNMNLVGFSAPDLKTRNQLLNLLNHDLSQLMNGIELPTKENEIRERINIMLAMPVTP
jgi:hypothetical protein